MKRHKTFLTVFVFLISLPLIAVLAQTQGAEAAPEADRHQGQEIRTFFLENAEVKDVMTMLRSLVGIKHVAANEEVNAILIRDTAENIELATEIVRTQDLPRNEVVVAAELLDLDRPVLLDLARGSGGGVPARLSRDELSRLRSSPGARVLAHPTLSAVAGKKAELLIGDRIPIDTGEGRVVYQEVGLKLVVVPRIHAVAGEVTLDFQVEMSHRAAGAGTPERPVIETRSVVSSTRLGDGESYLVTGLTGAGPSTVKNGEREIGLVLTPRIVRRIDAGRRDPGEQRR